MNNKKKFNRAFVKYFFVGLLNTSIHWIVFVFLVHFLNFKQVYSNFFAFGIAATFSFFCNAKFTFSKKATKEKYVAFVSFMGVTSYFIGFLAEKLHYKPIITLIIFSTISLFLGFLYSKFIIFKGVE